MSTLNKVTKKCAICGKEHTYIEVVSTMTSGYMDLDTRPPRMKRATLEYEIQFCNNCHYANDDIETVIEGFKKETLQNPAYLKVVNDNNINSIAKSFLLAGYLYANSKEYYEAGIQYLKAAWIFDDSQEIDYAKRARVKALQYLTIFVEETENMNLAVLCVDLQRRTGDFLGAIETAQQLIDYGAEEFLTRILKFEKKLSQNNDSTCHNVGEVE